jgi:tRNA-dihydrouridine synthase
MHIWQRLYQRAAQGGPNITALAPMADVTDRAYRNHILNESGFDAVDLLWTEFVAVDGLASRGKYQLMRDLQYTTTEQPKLIAQIFGSNPEKFKTVIPEIINLGYTAIDINMGCPDRSINRQGAGACLIQTPELAAEIVRVCKDSAGNVPISVKTRIGWNSDESESWIPTLLDAGIDALTVHARTRSELSLPPAHWDVLEKIVAMSQPYQIPVLANGGIITSVQGDDVCRQSGAHGYMVGKATFGNPYFFRLGGTMPDKKSRLQSALNHLILYHDWIFRETGPGQICTDLVFGEHSITSPEIIHGKSLELMKKNFRCYITDWPGSNELRNEIMLEKAFEGLVAILQREIQNCPNN